MASAEAIPGNDYVASSGWMPNDTVIATLWALAKQGQIKPTFVRKRLP